VDAWRVYEKALVGVAKTTNLSGKELQQFSKDITQLSRDLKGAATAEELLGIAQAAGQLGVNGAENIKLFTATIAKLGQASDLSGDLAATTLARILTVTGEGVGKIDIFASQIVALGNNFAATESEIARMANEVARATAQFDVSAGEAAALGTAMKAMGVQAELGSSVMGKSFRVIDKAVRQGGETLKDLVELTGVTGDVLKKTFEEDAVAAFTLFAEGLGRVAGANGDVTAELEKFGLKGEEVLKVLPVLAKNSELLALTLKKIKEEAENGGEALEKEFGAAIDTLDSRIKLLDITFKNLKTSIGQSSSGITNSIVTMATASIKGLDDLLKKWDEIKLNLADREELIAAGKEIGFEFSTLSKIIGIGTDELQRIREAVELFEKAKEQRSKASAQPTLLELATKVAEAEVKITTDRVKNAKEIAEISNNVIRDWTDFMKFQSSEVNKQAAIQTALIASRKSALDKELQRLADNRAQEKALFGREISRGQTTGVFKDQRSLDNATQAMNLLVRELSEGRGGISDAQIEKLESAIKEGQAGGGSAADAVSEVTEIFTLAFVPVIGQIATLIKTIAALPETIKSFVNGVLDAFASWDDTVEKFFDELPQRIEAAFLGVADAIARIFSAETAKLIFAAMESAVTGFVDAIAVLFGGSVDRRQTVGETAQLEALIVSINKQSQSIERAGWGNSDWQSELTKLTAEKSALDRQAVDFWESFIDISQSEFDAIKQLNTTQEEALSTLKNIVNTLEDTINTLLGSTFNPDQTFATAQATYEKLLEQASAAGLSPSEREDAVAGLTSFITGFLEKAQAQFGSSAAYQNLFAQVLEDLANIQGFVSGDVATTASDLVDTTALLEELARVVGDAIAESVNEAGETIFENILAILTDIWNFFDGIWRAFIKLFETFVGVIQTVFDGISGFLASIETFLKNIGDALEALVSAIEGLGGGDISLFADGGIVNKPTIAMVGEAGPEAFIPLKNGSVPVSFSGGGGGGDNEATNQLLRQQNSLLMTLINTTENGLQIDGQSFNNRSARVADGVFLERFNRGVDLEAGLVL